MKKKPNIQKILYWTFLFTTIVACTTAGVVDFMFARAFYSSGDKTIIWDTITATITWSWLLLLLLLMVRKELGIIPLIITTFTSLQYTFQNFYYTGVIIMGLTGFCNNVAAIFATLMVVVGYGYYFTVYFQWISHHLIKHTDHTGNGKSKQH